MSRDSMVSVLLGEAYAATALREPRAMDPRRVKRLLRLDGSFAETVHRAVAAEIYSRKLRAFQRNRASKAQQSAHLTPQEKKL